MVPSLHVKDAQPISSEASPHSATPLQRVMGVTPSEHLGPQPARHAENEAAGCPLHKSCLASMQD
jgi:hypothetical protein